MKIPSMSCRRIKQLKNRNILFDVFTIIVYLCMIYTIGIELARKDFNNQIQYSAMLWVMVDLFQLFVFELLGLFFESFYSIITDCKESIHLPRDASKHSATRRVFIVASLTAYFCIAFLYMVTPLYWQSTEMVTLEVLCFLLLLISIFFHVGCIIMSYKNKSLYDFGKDFRFMSILLLHPINILLYYNIH